MLSNGGISSSGVNSHPSEAIESSLPFGTPPRTVSDHQSVSWSSNGSCVRVLRWEVLRSLATEGDPFWVPEVVVCRDELMMT